MAYEWGVNGGVMKYTYPSDKRPDTSEDVLSLGFISPSFDAVLVRVDSDPKMNNDYLQLEIVSTYLPKGHLISEANFLVLVWTKKRKKSFFDFCPKDLK